MAGRIVRDTWDIFCVDSIIPISTHAWNVLTFSMSFHRVLGSESLYSAYYFLVDSNVVDVHHDIDRTGPLLCIAAGSHESKPYALVESLLRRGANPNDRADIHGDRTALASAAGNSDKKMVSQVNQDFRINTWNYTYLYLV